MLFFMGAASHLPIAVNPSAHFSTLFGVLAVLILALEANALKGKTGPITTVKGVITCGFALTAVLYTLIEILVK
jgi:hypothetical protein